MSCPCFLHDSRVSYGDMFSLALVFPQNLKSPVPEIPAKYFFPSSTTFHHPFQFILTAVSSAVLLTLCGSLIQYSPAEIWF